MTTYLWLLWKKCMKADTKRNWLELWGSHVYLHSILSENWCAAYLHNLQDPFKRFFWLCVKSRLQLLTKCQISISGLLGASCWGKGTRTFYQCADLKWQSSWETEMSEMTLNLVPAHDEVLVMDLSHGSDTSHSQREKKFPSSVVVVRVENVSLNRWLIPIHFPLLSATSRRKETLVLLVKVVFLFVCF